MRPIIEKYNPIDRVFSTLAVDQWGKARDLGAGAAAYEARPKSKMNVHPPITVKIALRIALFCVLGLKGSSQVPLLAVRIEDLCTRS